MISGITDPKIFDKPKTELLGAKKFTFHETFVLEENYQNKTVFTFLACLPCCKQYPQLSDHLPEECKTKKFTALFTSFAS